MFECNIYTILIFIFLLIIFGIITFDGYKYISFNKGLYTTAGMKLQFLPKEHYHPQFPHYQKECPGLYGNTKKMLKCNQTLNFMKFARRPGEEIDHVKKFCCM